MDGSRHRNRMDGWVEVGTEGREETQTNEREGRVDRRPSPCVHGLRCSGLTRSCTRRRLQAKYAGFVGGGG